jgi:ABC-type sugar transport system substrate-binding protein
MSTHSRRRWHGGCAAMFVLVTSMAGGYGVASSYAAAPSGHVEGLPESGEVVFFGLSQQNPYVAQWHEGARTQAEEYGWTLRYVESQNSQQEQDGQITQLLGSPDQPLGIVLAPFQGEAAAASMQAIKNAGIPLVIIDAEPPVEQEPLYDIYTGANDILSAETSADLLVAAAEARGLELDGGLIIGCPWDWLGCSRRRDAFPEALAEVAPDAEIVASYPSEGFGPAEGYEVAAQVIPAEIGSFNFVYTLNDAIGDGVIQALEENGLVAGEDVLVVGGTCLGVATNQMVIDGQLAGTAVQSPFVEGQLTVINLAQFLNNGGEVLPGAGDVSPEEPPSLDEPPHKYNYMPNPAVETAADFEEVTIWGRTAEELCSYT